MSRTNRPTIVHNRKLSISRAVNCLKTKGYLSLKIALDFERKTLFLPLQSSKRQLQRIKRAKQQSSLINETKRNCGIFVINVQPNHRAPTQSVCVADCYFIVNVLDLPFASLHDSDISLTMYINQ